MRLSTRYYQLEYKEAAVRWIKSGDVEIIRMIYSAVRDHNWETLKPKILEENIIQNKDDFEVVALVEYKSNSISFEAKYKITGNESQLKFEMDGKARSTFQSNRIGFCVLHPVKECAGKICTVTHSDGISENRIFPVRISPNQPMLNISELEWKPAGSVKAKLSFSGDVFEMEDQRNWTDASYKTYCRPLERPFPYSVKKNEKISQRILLEIQGPPHNNSKNDVISFSIDKNKKFKIPKIGVCSASRIEPLEQSEAEILKQLPLKHLRGEIKLFEKSWKLNLQRVIEETTLLNLPLYLVLYFSDNYKNEVHDLGVIIHEYAKQIKYILVVGKNHLYDNELFKDSIKVLKELIPNVKFGAGVNAYFAELNRIRPKTEKAEFISFTICPQVHAFDKASLTENLEGQKYTVESAKTLYPSQPIFISPVTFKQRFNVVATSEEPEPKPDKLPNQVDARQNTLFAAQWLLGSLKYLSQANADLVTYFETVGWRGFIQGNFNPPVPEKFSARKGDIFPVYYLLKEFQGFNKVIFSESNSPLDVDGIVLLNESSENENIRILIANFTGSPQKTELKGNYENYKIRSLLGKEINFVNGNIIEIPSSEIVVIENGK